MTIFTDTYIPYEFDNKQQCLKYVENRCNGIKKALRKVEKNNEHLKVRCPLSGDYLDIVGTTSELEWMDNQLKVLNLYRA